MSPGVSTVTRRPQAFQPAVLCFTESVEELVGGTDAVTNWASGNALERAPTWQECDPKLCAGLSSAFLKYANRADLDDDSKMPGALVAVVSKAVKELIAVEKNRAKAATKKIADDLRSSTQRYAPASRRAHSTAPPQGECCRRKEGEGEGPPQARCPGRPWYKSQARLPMLFLQAPW